LPTISETSAIEAIASNDEKILELLACIPEENVAIANALTELVMNFQHHIQM
jgi:hypothetical protein